jgi:hypothetical protein
MIPGNFAQLMTRGVIQEKIKTAGQRAVKENDNEREVAVAVAEAVCLATISSYKEIRSNVADYFESRQNNFLDQGNFDVKRMFEICQELMIFTPYRMNELKLVVEPMLLFYLLLVQKLIAALADCCNIDSQSVDIEHKLLTDKHKDLARELNLTIEYEKLFSPTINFSNLSQTFSQIYSQIFSEISSRSFQQIAMPNDLIKIIVSYTCPNFDEVIENFNNREKCQT